MDYVKLVLKVAIIQDEKMLEISFRLFAENQDNMSE
jgi:hypothetical protein